MEYVEWLVSRCAGELQDAGVPVEGRKSGCSREFHASRDRDCSMAVLVHFRDDLAHGPDCV